MWHRFAFRRRRLLLGVAFLIFLIIVLRVTFKSDNHGSAKSAVICKQPEEIREALHDLIIKTIDALQALPVSYFLCYNSLWGALNIKDPLPWDDTIQLCLQNEELSRFEEARIIRIFRTKGLTITYSSSVGEYEVVTRYDNKPKITLYVFEEDSITKQMRRIGWQNRIIPPDSCALLHCFPPHLIEKPLPELDFLGLKVPAPREEVELQKYHFPDTWWKDQIPSECAHES